MSLSIEPYVSADRENVWQLHMQTISQNDGFAKNLSFHSDLHHISDVYDAFFIVRDAARVVGIVGLKRVDDKVLEVKRLQVAPSYRGKGLGKNLMCHAIDYAKKRGVTKLCLDVSMPQVKARELYLGLGFVIVHEEIRTYGPDREEFFMMFMEKEL